MWLNVSGRSCWVENKIDAMFQRDQLLRYSALGPGLVIAPRRRAAQIPESTHWAIVSWTETADMAAELFDEEGISLDDAGLPSVEARYKARSDLMGYLKESGLTTPRALTDADIEAFGNLNFVLGEALPYLLAVVGDQAVARGLVVRKIQKPPEYGAYDYGYTCCVSEPESWVGAIDGWYDATLAGCPDFADKPALGVGAWFLTDLANPAQAIFHDERWKNTLEEAGFQRVLLDWGSRAVRAITLASVTGKDLGEQAEAVAEHFLTAVGDLRELQSFRACGIILSRK